MNTDFSEKDFDTIIYNIKTENDSLFDGESSDVEDLLEPAYVKFVDDKIVSRHTSSPSTVLPIMKISPKSGLHICLKYCFKCNKGFSVFDSPLHIRQLRNIDKQTEFLKIEPLLCVDSCLCDFCWRNLEKTYKSNKSKNIKEESFSEKRSRLLERYRRKSVSKNQNQARICSIHLCSQPYQRKMTVDECENIKKLLLSFESCRLIFVQSTKETIDFLKFPFCVCEFHNSLILVMSSCQICGDNLIAPFNADDWSMYEMWNFVLIENKLPLILKPGMFICVTCKGHISKTNSCFPTIDLPHLHKYILTSNTVRSYLYGESLYNLSNVCQESIDMTPPIVVPKIEEECVHSTKVKFSDPLVITNYNFENNYYKNKTESITSATLLNVAEQNLCTPKLEPKDEELDFVQHEEDYYNSMYSCIAAVEPPNTIPNPVSIKRKHSNVICDTISDKHIKIQKLNRKYSSYENNSIDDNITKSYRNKNIVHVSPFQFKRTLKKNPKFRNKKKSCVKNVLLDKDISDSNSLSDSIILSDSPADSEILGDQLLDSEMFSETDSEDILPYREETDFMIMSSGDDLSLDSNCELVKSKLKKFGCRFVSGTEKSLDDKIILNDENVLESYTTLLDSVNDSNREIVPDAKTKLDSDEQSHKNLSVTEEEFNDKILSTFKIVSNTQKESDDEMLLDGDKVFETASWSKKGAIKYKIITDDEIKPSGNIGSTCIIISDNDEEFNNKVFSTYKMDVLKGSDNKILLDGEVVKIISRTEKRMEYFDFMIESSNRKTSKCIIIYDDKKEFINKRLSTFKIVSNIKKRSYRKMLSSYSEKIYDIDCDSENGKIKYMIVSKGEIESSGIKRSQCTITSNNKKSTFKVLVNNVLNGSHSVLLDDEKSRKMLSKAENGSLRYMIGSDNDDEFIYKKVSNNTIIVDGLKTFDDNNTFNNYSQLQVKNRHSFPCLELIVNEDGDTQDKTQKYFKDYYSAIRDFCEKIDDQSFKDLYSLISNDRDVLLYLLENLRMFYNGELVVSETADEFSKKYLNEQKNILNNWFGNPEDSINSSKTFIPSTSHLNIYSKRLTPNIRPPTIKNITTATSTSTQDNLIVLSKNSLAPKNGIESKFNNIRTSKLLPLFNSVSKSRLTPYLPDDNQTFTPLILQHQAKCNIQFPVAIKKKTVGKSKLLLLPICKLKK